MIIESRLEERAAKGITPRAGALWLWEAHNNVSYRLASSWGRTKQQVIYPTQDDCPYCRRQEETGGEEEATVKWDADAVFTFLNQTYRITNKNNELDDDVGYVPGTAPGPMMTSWELFVLCLCFLAFVVGGLIYGRRYSTNRGGVPRSSSSDPSSSLDVAQEVELESLHVPAADGTRERCHDGDSSGGSGDDGGVAGLGSSHGRGENRNLLRSPASSLARGPSKGESTTGGREAHGGNSKSV